MGFYRSMTSNSARTFALVVSLAFLATACSGGTSGTGQTPPPQGGGADGVVSILDFSAPSLSGGTIDGADYSGKAVALWFWAPW